MQVYVVGKTNTITNSLKSQKRTMGNGERMKQIYILTYWMLYCNCTNRCYCQYKI